MPIDEGIKNGSERLESLYRLKLLDTEAEERFDRLTRLVRSVFGFSTAMITLIDDSRQWCKSHSGPTQQEVPLDVSFCARAIEQDDVYIVKDASRSPEFSDNPLVNGSTAIRFYAGAPLKARDGNKVGALCLMDATPRAFSDEDKQQLRLFADIAEEYINQADLTSTNREGFSLQAHSKAIWMAMPDMIFVVNRDGVFVGSNNHPDQLLKDDQLIGSTLQEVMPVEMAHQALNAITVALSSQGVVTFEYELNIDELKYYESRVRPIDDHQVLFVIRDITSEVRTQRDLAESRALVNAIVNAQSQFIHEDSSEHIFQLLLDDLLSLTHSEYGFVGEVRFDNKQPYVVAKAISEVASGNDFFRQQILQSDGELAFRKTDSLIAATLSEPEYLISNDPYQDDRSGGIPKGHPRLDAFIGIPIRYNGTLCAMLGLANRSGGYQDEDYQFLKPLLNTIGQMFDVANRREEADWANQQIRLLSEVSRQTSNGIVIADLDGRIEWVNNAFVAITGFDFEEVKGRKPGDFLQGPESDIKVIEYMSSRLKKREGFNVELINYSKAGRPYWINVSCSVLNDEQGTVTGFLAIQNDIDAQKRSEIATADGLRLQQAIVNTMTDGLITTDNLGTIQMCNPAAEQIFGYSEDYLIGKNINLLMPESYSSHHDHYMEKYRVSQSKHSIMGRTRDLSGKRKDGSEFPLEIAVSETQHEGISLYVALIRDISEVKRQQIAIEKLAYYDPLTQLANRRLLDDRIAQAMAMSARSNSYCAVLIIDLDDFKNINDSLGHRMGDQLLVELGRRVSASIWHGDTAARLGGDEFCLLLASLGDIELQALERAKLVADRILKEILQPFVIEHKKLISSSSIGITLFRGEGVDQDELLKQADIAMYEAKKAGKGRVSLFNHDMEQRIVVRLARQSELKQAISDQSLSVCYQPKVDHSGEIVGLEALVRWIHPVDGFISPEEFIPIAEDHQLIIPLGEFVLRRALSDMEHWLSIYPKLDWTLAINISQFQLSSELFQNQIETAFRDFKVNPETVVLEVTESALAKQIEESISRIMSLKTLGITFSLDDFGTGYSSLAYLKQLPISELKIDRSFVRDLPSGVEDVKIVNSILSLAKALQLTVVAEGVESREQWHFLKESGCDHFQGYYFSKPITGSEIEQLVRTDRSLHRPL